jgi:fructose-bisphosphate aldolase class II
MCKIGAYYTRNVAKAYGIPVVLHSDHCAKSLLPWFDGMIKANEDYFKIHGEPLFSSHMLDLSEEPKAENIEICKGYLKRMAPMGLLLEMEIGITGGEEDGVNNEHVDNASLYTQPEDIWDIYREFSEITDLFTIAAAFGNVHGVYKPGNVKLHPELLGKHQALVQEKLKTTHTKPVFFVFHGGSGSSAEEIKTAVSFGVVKVLCPGFFGTKAFKLIQILASDECGHGHPMGVLGRSQELLRGKEGIPSITDWKPRW